MLNARLLLKRQVLIAMKTSHRPVISMLTYGIHEIIGFCRKPKTSKSGQNQRHAGLIAVPNSEGFVQNALVHTRAARADEAVRLHAESGARLEQNQIRTLIAPRLKLTLGRNHQQSTRDQQTGLM